MTNCLSCGLSDCSLALTLLCVSSSTGRASNLTSPTSEFSPEPSDPGTTPALSSSPAQQDTPANNPPAPEKIKHSSSSIIGLRAATFDTGAGAVRVEETEEAKPRPPPKPRPWSIVGLDRQSGEVSTVEPHQDRENSPGRPASPAAEPEPGPAAVASRGSVRDMIANLNKPEAGEAGGGSVGGLLGAASVRDRIASMNKGEGGGGAGGNDRRKGNSLPRATDGLTAGSSSAKSPGLAAKHSPHNLRRDTTDDPRILKLEDDFMYEDTVNV